MGINSTASSQFSICWEFKLSLSHSHLHPAFMIFFYFEDTKQEENGSRREWPAKLMAISRIINEAFLSRTSFLSGTPTTGMGRTRHNGPGKRTRKCFLKFFCLRQSFFVYYRIMKGNSVATNSFCVCSTHDTCWPRSFIHLNYSQKRI